MMSASPSDEICTEFRRDPLGLLRSSAGWSIMRFNHSACARGELSPSLCSGFTVALLAARAAASSLARLNSPCSSFCPIAA
eukprot:7378041-Prymnesium_polylepis.1